MLNSQAFTSSIESGDPGSPLLSSIRSAENLTATDIWTADVETVFMEAYHKFPHTGRSKLMGPDGHLHGRNELISLYIFEKTGKVRTRKQVSSHIQVLLKKLSKQRSSLSLSGTDQVMTANFDIEDCSDHGMVDDFAHSPDFDFSSDMMNSPRPPRKQIGQNCNRQCMDSLDNINTGTDCFQITAPKLRLNQQSDGAQHCDGLELLLQAAEQEISQHH
ncbi:hypothetical protein MIR68_007698 [Amoeboaphelidium protococcarum]|nr:hypothetical protein MIR68_007698 [Amoeboaphelidium protococcarum]